MPLPLRYQLTNTYTYIHTYIRPAKDRNGNVPACPKGPFTSETREGRESKVSCVTSDSPPISQLRGDSIYFCHASEKSIRARIICYCSTLTPTPFPPIYALLLTLLWHFSLSPQGKSSLCPVLNPEMVPISTNKKTTNEKIEIHGVA